MAEPVRGVRLLRNGLIAATLAGLAIGCSSPPSTPTPILVAAPTESPQPALPTLAVATLSPPAIATPQPLVVAGTGAEGVSLRRTPGTSGERLKVWPDGTLMSPLGEDQRVDNRDWKRVRDPDGTEGWVAAEFLVDPAVATAMPAPTVAPTVPPATRAPTVAPTLARPTPTFPPLRPTFTPASASTPAPNVAPKPAAPTATSTPARR